MTTTVRVKYHQEADGWWAESPDVDGFVASGSTLHEVRELTREGLPFYLEVTDLELVEEGPASAVVVDWTVLADVMARPSTSSSVTGVKVRGVGAAGASGHRPVAGVA